MRYVLTAVAAATLVALAGCERPASTSSTTVVKEQPVVQKEKETVVQREPSTTIVQPAPAPSSTTIVQPSAPPSSSSTSVNIEASKPTTERSQSTSTTRIDTPMGTATKTETETTKTTR